MNGTKDIFLSQYKNCLDLNYEKRLIEASEKVSQDIEACKQTKLIKDLSFKLSGIKNFLGFTNSELENTLKAIEELKNHAAKSKKTWKKI